jgi:hypothetical protein
MTIALCLRCGHLKHGALCPCPKCQDKGTGDPQLDIAFSDHVVASSVLGDLGKIISLINKSDEKEELVKRWAFLWYVSENCSQILSVQIPPEISEKVTALYNELHLPKVEWKPGLRNDPTRKTAKGCLLTLTMILGFSVLGIAWSLL